MYDTIRTSPAILSLVGLISGALTILVSSISGLHSIAVGFTFGLTLIAYFKGFERQDSPLKLVLFLCVCTVAWPVANLCAFGTMVLGQTYSWIKPQSLIIPLPVFFVGGFTGALLVLGAGAALFGCRRVGIRDIAMVALYSIGCGLLGVIGAAADGSRTQGKIGRAHV